MRQQQVGKQHDHDQQQHAPTPTTYLRRKQGQFWPGERTFSGTDEHGTEFTLRLSRDVNGTLLGEYRVKAKGQRDWSAPWPVRGTLYQGTEGAKGDPLTLEGSQNSALFSGARIVQGADGWSVHTRFSRKNYHTTLHLREQPVPALPAARTAAQKTLKPWNRTYHAQLADSHLSLKLECNGREVRGQFNLGNVGAGSVQGQMQDGGQLALTATYTAGRYKGQTRAVNARLESDSTLRGTWSGGERPYPLHASVPAPASTKASAPVSDTVGVDPPSSWETTIKPAQRAKLPALQEEGFLEHLGAMAARLEVPRDLILAFMTFESWLEPKAVNGANGKYFGLIQVGNAAVDDMQYKPLAKQFLKERNLPAPKDAPSFTQMSAVEQLPYVELYLLQHGIPQAVKNAKAKGQTISLEHLYMSVLAGHAMHADKQVQFMDDPHRTKEQGDPYDQNKGLDTDGDGKIETVETTDVVRIRWRNTFGTNLDERSKHLYEKQQSNGKKQIVHNAKHVNPLPMNTDPSVAALLLGTPLEVTAEDGASEAAHGELRTISTAQKEAIKRLLDGGLSTSEQQQVMRGIEIGSLDGVVGYYNGNAEAQTWGGNYQDGKYCGEKWQCVEFVRRYYLSVLGLHLTFKGHANKWYTPGAQDGQRTATQLVQYNNGSETKPKYQDILVLQTNSFGHVAIIAEVNEESVVIAQQNVKARFLETLPLEKIVRNGKVVWEIRNALCWLRKG